MKDQRRVGLLAVLALAVALATPATAIEPCCTANCSGCVSGTTGGCTVYACQSCICGCDGTKAKCCCYKNGSWSCSEVPCG